MTDPPGLGARPRATVTLPMPVGTLEELEGAAYAAGVSLTEALLRSLDLDTTLSDVVWDPVVRDTETGEVTFIHDPPGGEVLLALTLPKQTRMDIDRLSRKLGGTYDEVICEAVSICLWLRKRHPWFLYQLEDDRRRADELLWTLLLPDHGRGHR